MASQNNPPAGQVPLIDPNNVETTGPYKGLPKLPDGMVWHQFPYNSLFLSDPIWYDSLGINLLDRREVWDITDVEELHKVLKEIYTECPNKGMDIVFKAAVKGRADVIRWAMGEGIKLHPSGGNGGAGGEATGGEEDDMSCVPVHAAAANGNLECVKVLIEEGGIIVDATCELGGTPVMRAARENHNDILKWLIQKGADLTLAQWTDGQGDWSALDFAASAGNLEGVKMLYDALAEKALADGKDTTSIITTLTVQAAANSKDFKTLEYILSKGGFPTQSSEEGNGFLGAQITAAQKETIRSALHRATIAGSDVLELLFSYLTPKKDGQFDYFDSDPELKDKLCNAAGNALVRGDIDTFNLVWKTGLDDPKSDIIAGEAPGSRSKQDVLANLFTDVLREAPLPAIRHLVQQYGVDPHTAVDQHYSSALYKATSSNNIEVVRYLLEEHAFDIDLASGKFANGPTALAIAVLEGHKDVVKLLLKYGGPVEVIEQEVEFKEARKLIISAAMVYRQDVKVIIAGAEREAREQNSNQGRVMIVVTDEEDTTWLHSIRKRKTDEELKAADIHKRELRKPDA
ncbi:ankyrin [Aaosphaeria arxii CBS 175.79]|uniref:Ankyrin n=1 Tax=Aaosphaeria arxii CBS 175.79 TaxID=1450172 RepID=A0A6A5XZJ9_9PLEO|nr:ankyrin [Aaosphaeria arxii CBS 175.79]KAF2018725.1 ankyrin [Aaosphaeria arxii CBS 175.79]